MGDLIGVEVTVRNLNARPELNGRTGTIVAAPNKAGRYAVKLDESGRTVAIRKDDEELIKPHAEDVAARAGTTLGRVVAVG